jgi:hypothetical protein
MARNMKMELHTFSLILYQLKKCGHRIHVLFMMYVLILSNEEKTKHYENFEKGMIYTMFEFQSVRRSFPRNLACG